MHAVSIAPWLLVQVAVNCGQRRRATYGYRPVWAMVNRTFRIAYNRKPIRGVMYASAVRKTAVCGTRLISPGARVHRASAISGPEYAAASESANDVCLTQAARPDRLSRTSSYSRKTIPCSSSTTG
jgi:hypothetical protein